jgi:hypothetical protein
MCRKKFIPIRGVKSNLINLIQIPRIKESLENKIFDSSAK